MERGGPPQHLVRLPLIAIVPCIGSFLARSLARRLILIAVGINSDPRRQHWFDKFAGGTQVRQDRLTRHRPDADPTLHPARDVRCRVERHSVS